MERKTTVTLLAELGRALLAVLDSVLQLRASGALSVVVVSERQGLDQLVPGARAAGTVHLWVPQFPSKVTRLPRRNFVS